MMTDHPILVVVRGLPGSGKSHLVAGLLKLLDPSVYVSLDPDAVDTTSDEYRAHSRQLSAEGIEERVHLYRFSRARAMKAIEERKLIVWNQPFSIPATFNRLTDFLQDYAVAHGTRLSILLVEMQLDPDVAYKRVVERRRAGGHGPSEAMFQRYNNDYKSYAEHGYRVLKVRGDDDGDAAALKVLGAIQKIASE